MSSATATNIALQPIPAPPALPALPAPPAPPAPALAPGMNPQDMSVEEALDMFNVQVGDPRRVAYIPRTDGGRDAWMFLIASLVISALIWGFPLSFGVIQAYSQNGPLVGELASSAISAVGFVSVGIMFLGTPACLYLYDSRPSLIRAGEIFGLLIVAASLLAASYTKSILALVFTQGVMYGIGASFLYASTVAWLYDWFINRQGLANLILSMGYVISIASLPFVLKWMLNLWGFAVTLRIWSATFFICCTLLVFFLKPRIRLPFPLPPLQPTSWLFVRSRTHIALQFSNIIISLGYFFPNIHLASYAQSQGNTSNAAAGLIVILNVTYVIGEWMHKLRGLEETTFVFITFFSSATILIICILIFAKSYTSLVLFAIFYGYCVGALTGLWDDMVTVVQADPSAQFATHESIIGTFWVGRGIGLLVAALLNYGLYDHILASSTPGFGSNLALVLIAMIVTIFCGGLVCWLAPIPMLYGRARWTLLVPAYFR